jgi:hypothetical protein
VTLPRSSYSPKNRYLFNATISEEDTETLVWLYVQGLMAAGVADFYKLDFGDARKPPSTKTINKLFRNFGHYLFERLVETRLPPIGNMKEEFPDKHEQYLDSMARILVEFSLSKMSYETWRDLRGGSAIYAVDDQLPAEVRQIYSARKGQSSDPRSVLGLASLRSMVKRRYQSLVSAEQIPVIMYKTLLAFLEADPLGMQKDQRSRMLSDADNSEFEIEHVGKAEGEPSFGTYATGIEINDEAFANLLGLYLQSFSPDNALRAFKQVEPKEAEKLDPTFVQTLFLTFGRLLFLKLMMPNIPTDESFRRLFPEDNQVYMHEVASIIAQTALENPAGYSYHVKYRGHDVIFLHEDIVGDVRREYFAGDAQTIDAQGLIGLSTFRFVCASRLETGWQQPELFFNTHAVMLEWLKQKPLAF